MKNLRKNINAFLADEQGAETVEWVMIAAVLAVIIGAAFGPSSGLSTAVSASMGDIATAVNPAP